MIVKMNGQLLLDTAAPLQLIEPIPVSSWEEIKDLLRSKGKGFIIGSVIGGALAFLIPFKASAANIPLGVVDGQIIFGPPAPDLAVPVMATGGAAGGLAKLIQSYMDLADYIAWATFAFAGTAWMFGHRERAIELCIGGTFGFLIVLHAWDMVKFLKGLS